MFTIITETRVLRVRARSVQQVTQALHAAGIAYIGIHKDEEV